VTTRRSASTAMTDLASDYAQTAPLSTYPSTRFDVGHIDFQVSTSFRTKP
jgi:hypothetical protein